MNDPEWVRRRRVWVTQPSLLEHDAAEIFSLWGAAFVAGRKLQLGCGPGFLGGGRDDFATVGAAAHSGVHVACDAHALPFASAVFEQVVGIDVLHHFARPRRALAEIARALRPGGGCLLIEPWSGALGVPVYRFLHHEGCRLVAAPWTAAFAPAPGPMDGNAWIPRGSLWSRRNDPSTHAPELRVVGVEAFGGLSYLATGGFDPRGFSASVVRAFSAIESRLLQAVARLLALRAFFVLEREGSDGP